MIRKKKVRKKKEIGNQTACEGLKQTKTDLWAKVTKWLPKYELNMETLEIFLQRQYDFKNMMTTKEIYIT
jgi:hypothetical protein